MRLKDSGVHIEKNSNVTSVERENGKFKINFEDGSYINTDSVIIGTGSKAAPITGSDGFGYEICRRFGHNIIKPLPALVQLKCNEKFLKDWAGVRADVKVELYENNNKIASDIGEVQLTDYGISGICIFNLSGRASRGLDEGKFETVKINFVNGLGIENVSDLVNFLDERAKILESGILSELLDGLINYKLLNILLKISNLNYYDNWNSLDYDEKTLFAGNIVEFKIDIIGTNSFDKAQVCSGGVDLNEVNSKTMESKIIPGLYIVGELLDVDADCGGYNLEWAWITGMIAGMNCK